MQTFPQILIIGDSIARNVMKSYERSYRVTNVTLRGRRSADLLNEVNRADDINKTTSILIISKCVVCVFVRVGTFLGIYPAGTDQESRQPGFLLVPAPGRDLQNGRSEKVVGPLVKRP